MSDVQIGSALSAIVLDIAVFDEFFKELVASGALPGRIAFDTDTVLGRRNVTVLIGPPSFFLRAGGTPEGRTILELRGTLELRPEGQFDGPPDLTFPLDVDVRLSFELSLVVDEAPRIALVYEGVDGPPGAPVTADQVDALFARPEVAEVLASTTLNLPDRLIGGLEGVMFPEEDTAPTRDEWTVSLGLLSSDASSVDTVVVLVSEPGGVADAGRPTSFLPPLTGFGLVFGRRFLDISLAQGAEAKKDTKVEGATIKDITLEMEDALIHTDGRATKQKLGITATTTWDGPVEVGLVRGTTNLFTDTSGVSVDTPDVLEFILRFFGVFFSLIPVLNIPLGIWVVPGIWDAADQIEDAPGTIRNSLATGLGPQLAGLASGLTFSTDVAAVTLESTPDRLVVENGNFLLLAQVFVSQRTEDIVDGFFSKRHRRLVEFELQSGRRLRGAELARLVKLGKIVTPGFHAVEPEDAVRHMRANRDDARANNLLARFKDHLAGENAPP